MMRILDQLHRWTGGMLGLVLAMLGLSGALLSQKALWIDAPGIRDGRPSAPAELAQMLARLVPGDPGRLDYVLLSGGQFGLHRVGWRDGTGAYATHAGDVVARWDSVFDRPELWLFDLHHQLMAGQPGEVIAGGVALIGVGFILSGSVLWYRTRRKFRLRLWPAKLTPTAVAHHHRDLGIVLAPLLFLSCMTGAMLTLRPLSEAILSPVTARAEWSEAQAPPSTKGGPLPSAPNWLTMITSAHAAFPDAELRIISLPDNDGDLLTIRLKQPAEWHPNGRTVAWFDPETGALLAVRDALALPLGLQIQNALYPLHAGTTGSVVHQVMTTLTGLVLAILGSLTTWSFWFRRLRRMS